MRRTRLSDAVRRRRLALNIAAAVPLTVGLALAGFVGAGFAARSGSADPGTTAQGAPSTMCAKSHPCSNPGCREDGHGPADCRMTATVPTTTTAPTGSTAPSPCTRAHPCANPGCRQAGYGPLDCYDVTTTTATTTTAAPPPPTTQPSSTTTTEATTAASLTPPPPTTTQSAGATVPVSPPPTATERTTPSPGAPFVPPKLRKRQRHRASVHGSPAAGTLPYTGTNLTVALELAAGLFGAGLLLVLGGRKPRRLGFAGGGTPAFALSGFRNTESGRVPAAPPRPDPSRAYRVVIPGVGFFATVAEADRFIEEQGRTRRRESSGRLEEGVGYRIVRTELGPFASARNGRSPVGEYARPSRGRTRTGNA